jgi:hypothetical protein
MQVNNITELRNDLLKTYAAIKDGKIELDVAKESNNTAGKIINTIKVQLLYSELRKEAPTIDFLK